MDQVAYWTDGALALGRQAWALLGSLPAPALGIVLLGPTLAALASLSPAHVALALALNLAGILALGASGAAPVWAPFAALAFLAALAVALAGHGSRRERRRLADLRAQIDALQDELHVIRVQSERHALATLRGPGAEEAARPARDRGMA
jgi:hypothetical protein